VKISAQKGDDSLLGLSGALLSSPNICNSDFSLKRHSSPERSSQSNSLSNFCYYSVLTGYWRVSRIVVAYSTHGPASIDLVGAVLRQSTFIAKMSDIGWSKPGQLPRDQEINNLVRAVARYHAFLDLLSQSAYSFFVPTLVRRSNF
jgi:hypothetical protein